MAWNTMMHLPKNGWALLHQTYSLCLLYHDHRIHTCTILHTTNNTHEETIYLHSKDNPRETLNPQQKVFLEAMIFKLSM